MTFPICDEDVPWITTRQMIEVDRLMVEEYHIDLLQMMENAGRTLAHLARVRFLSGDVRGKRVIVLAGSGGNGGGAMAAARRLHNWGAAVQVVLTRQASAFTGVPAHQLEILQRMHAAIFPQAAVEKLGDASSADLIVDGIIGYSLSGAPRGTAAGLIRWANAQRVSILSLDLPSGVDSTTGQAHDPAIRAAATLTLALPKVGLRTVEAQNCAGELYLADIGVPPELYAETPLGLEVAPIFSTNDIVRLR